MASKVYSFRADEKLLDSLEKIMEENSLNKTEVIRLLHDNYVRPEGAVPNEIGKKILEIIMDMHTLLNSYAKTTNVNQARELLEVLTCQIL